MIYVDVSAAVHSRAGLGRYAERLAWELAQAKPNETALFHNLAADGQLPASLAHLPRRSVNYGYKPWRMAVWLAHLGRVPFTRLIPDATLFHSTEHLLFPAGNVPTVLTVHDLIFKLFPEYHKKLNYWYLNAAVPLFCRRATHIIAVSEATKRDIIEHYNIDPNKITVVYEAASEIFRPPTPDAVAQARQKYDLPADYLIHVSTIEPRKNLDRVLDVLHQIRPDYPDLKLLLIGSKGWLYEDFFARIEQEGLGNTVRHLGWIPDEDLPAIIAGARFGLQPSLYEGFGLPILEQMAVGQAVAASGVSSHPEVGGDAAVYFDPHNTAEMTAVIRRLLDNPDEVVARREQGLRQATNFSWEQTARETQAIYEKLL